MDNCEQYIKSIFHYIAIYITQMRKLQAKHFLIILDNFRLDFLKFINNE